MLRVDRVCTRKRLYSEDCDGDVCRKNLAGYLAIFAKGEWGMGNGEMGDGDKGEDDADADALDAAYTTSCPAEHTSDEGKRVV